MLVSGVYSDCILYSEEILVIECIPGYWLSLMKIDHLTNLKFTIHCWISIWAILKWNMIFSFIELQANDCCKVFINRNQIVKSNVENLHKSWAAVIRPICSFLDVVFNQLKVLRQPEMCSWLNGEGLLMRDSSLHAGFIVYSVYC